ncbi:MAG: hypothetical protein IT376_04730 [Polyangiaceae bacterium]|nr:hypothetical protein [Polyangiaceae bacterium]
MTARRDPLEALLAEWPVRGPDDATWDERAVEAVARAAGAGETPASLLEPPALAAEPGEPGSAEAPRSLADLARATLEAERREQQRPILDLAAIPAARPAPAPAAPAAAGGPPPARVEAEAQPPAPGAAVRGGGGRWRSSTVLAVALAVGAAGIAIGLGPLASRGPASGGPASGGLASVGAAAGGQVAPPAGGTPAPAAVAVGPQGGEPGVVDPLAPVPAAGPRGAAGGGGAPPGGAGARVAAAPPAPASPGGAPTDRPAGPGEDDPPPLPGGRNAEKGGDLPEKPSSGAVQAALGAVMGAARSCVAGHDQASTVTVAFGSDGRVTSVVVSAGPAAGTPAAACIQAALGRARVEPFARATFSVGATVRPP